MSRASSIRAGVASAFAFLASAFAFVPSRAAEAPAPPQTLRKFAEGFVAPIVLSSLDSHRLIVGDQAGLIYVLAADGQRREEPFLDLRPKLCKLNDGFDERGLLGFARHPKFSENRKLYVVYSAPLRANVSTNWDHTMHLSEFQTTPDFARIDPASERLLLEIDEPYFNHNGGRIAFGPDGHLYFGVGDGGNMNDQGHDRPATGNAQNLGTLLGKILRLDIDHPAPGKPYGIPSDNPFVSDPKARPEIFAYGIRNPWGFSFDRGGHRELIAADVGQNRFEEVNLIVKGGNYGWNRREARHPFNPKDPNQAVSEPPLKSAEDASLIDPVITYKNSNLFPNDPEAAGISVTGGYFYRGKALPHLEGRYIFGDWSKQWAVPDGRIYFATRPESGNPGNKWTMKYLPVASHPNYKIGEYLYAFGEDDQGELYVLTNHRNSLVDRTGAVWKLVPPK